MSWHPPCFLQVSSLEACWLLFYLLSYTVGIQASNVIKKLLIIAEPAWFRTLLICLRNTMAVKTRDELLYTQRTVRPLAKCQKQWQTKPDFRSSYPCSPHQTDLSPSQEHLLFHRVRDFQAQHFPGCGIPSSSVSWRLENHLEVNMWHPPLNH